MPEQGGFKMWNAGWNGRSSIYVDFVSAQTDKLFQLYANRKLIAVTTSYAERRVAGQVWDAHLSASPINLLAVSPDESFTDYGDDLEEEPWNRYVLSFTVPADYDADTKFFEILKASAFDTSPTEVVANVPYVGPKTYLVDLPAIPTLPLDQPVSANEPSRWQDWIYSVVPHDDASPAGNSGTPTNITIPALIFPADLVLREDGNRFGIALTGSALTISYAVPA